MTVTTRERILAAAAELFAEHGYHGVGMRAIADAVGVRGASLYHYFPSKQDILFAIATASTSEFIERHLPTFEADPDVLHALRVMLDAHIRYFHEHRTEQAVSLRELPTMKGLDLQRYRQIQAVRRRYQRAIQSRIEFAVLDGQIDDVDADLVALSILGMVTGISNWFREGGPRAIGEVAAGYCEIITTQLLRSRRCAD